MVYFLNLLFTVEWARSGFRLRPGWGLTVARYCHRMNSEPRTVSRRRLRRCQQQSQRVPCAETWDVPSLRPANASQIIDWFLSACFCNRCLSCVTVRLKIWKHSRAPKYFVVQQVTCGKPFLFFLEISLSLKLSSFFVVAWMKDTMS